ncbi:acyltransferase [Deinococcus metalli]|nr:acyltransferase [Deinococcus metalli]
MTAPSAPSAPSVQPTPRRRPSARASVDTFRGITILEVIIHHSTGVALRHLPPDSTSYLVAEIVNRTLHFAVPAFVFLSALVLTRSLLRRYDLRRYAFRRTLRAAWPYLLWTVLYALWYVWTGQRTASALDDPAQWRSWLLYGKASFHLYFLLVALEVYAVLPLLVLIARRRPRISDMLLIGIPLQLGLYFLNRYVLHLQYPTSTVMWYVLPLLLGVSVGSRLREFPQWWLRHRWALLALLAAVFAFYLPESLKFLRTGHATPVLFDALSWAYTTLVALLLLGVVWRMQLRPGALQRRLANLGIVSLQVYLMHPVVLQFLEGWNPPRGTEFEVLSTLVVYLLIATIIPALIAQMLRRTAVGLLLFGR